jgi:hypothetical protein
VILAPRLRALVLQRRHAVWTDLVLLSALTPVVEAVQTKRLGGWAKRFWFYFWGIALAPSGLLRAITLRRIVRSGIVADARSSLNTKARNTAEIS